MNAMGSVIRKRPNAAVLAAIAFVAFWAWAGCASAPAPKPAADASMVKTVLVLPFTDMSLVYGLDQGVRSPISGQAFITGPVEADACQFLTEKVTRFLGEQSPFTPVPYEDAQGAIAQVLNQKHSSMLSMESVCQVGQSLGVDGIVVGHVYRFRDRVGKAYSVDTPASVAFDVHLVRVNEKRILWSGRYDETQKALSDNLLHFPKFIKRGGAWVTAQKLASTGLDKALENFPKP